MILRVCELSPGSVFSVEGRKPHFTVLGEGEAGTVVCRRDDGQPFNFNAQRLVHVLQSDMPVRAQAIRLETATLTPINEVTRPTPSVERLEQGFKLILEGLGIDPTDPHFVDTPKRAAKAWFTELCRGLVEDVPEVRTFPTKVDQMILLKSIPIRSLCAHHLLPFIGTATIAYIPGNGKILGLSKLSRITDYCCRRPQVQEELTEHIADMLASKVIKVSEHGVAGGVGVVITANHMCMQLRGVQHNGEMITSALRGVLLTKPEARAEFLQLTFSR